MGKFSVGSCQDQVLDPGSLISVLKLLLLLICNESIKSPEERERLGRGQITDTEQTELFGKLGTGTPCILILPNENTCI